MKINQIIKEKRISQGLTQEQVANYLGVSAPAVNKWEKGASYPDITLLPPLARLLKVDLNTLLSFNDDLSDDEIGHFINSIARLIHDDSFASGYENAMEKINEYPNCHKLILNLAVVLQGSLQMFNPDEAPIYEDKIVELYERCRSSEDVDIRYQATSMLISKIINNGDYQGAQALLDTIPNIEFDKKQQQGILYMQSNKLSEASELFERKLILAANDIHTILVTMIEIALKENRNDDAKYFAEVIGKSTELFDLWEYNTHSAYFQMYVAEKDRENCILALQKMLLTLQKKWNISASKLYKHIKEKPEKPDEQSLFSKHLIDLIKNDKELEFLRDSKEFLELIGS